MFLTPPVPFAPARTLPGKREVKKDAIKTRILALWYKRTAPAFFLSLFLFSPALSAKDKDMELNLKKCFEIAVKNNPVILSQKLKTRQARHNYFSGINDYLPQVSLSHSASVSGFQGQPSSNSYSSRISANEKIFSLRTLNSVKKKKIAWEKSLIDYKAKSASLRYDVARAFLELLFLQEEIKVQEKIVKIRTENARLLKLKYESGRESRGDMLYAEALREIAETNLENAGRSVNSTSNGLSKLLGYPLETTIKAKGEFRLPPMDLTMEKATVALEKSPEMMSLKKDIESARESVFSSKAYLYPELTASQSVSWSGDNELPGSQSWNLGLSLSLPLFSGGPTSYKNNLESSRLSLDALKKTYENSLRSLKSELNQAYLDFLNASGKAEAQKKMLEATTERYREAQIKYMAGKINFLDLENLDQNLVDAELNRIEYLKTANLKKILLEKILGATLEDY